MSRLLTALQLMPVSLLDGFLAYRHYEHLRTRRIAHSIALKAAMADRPQAVTREPAIATQKIMHARPAHA